MAAIINALFGTYPDPEQPNTNATHTVVEGTNSTTERLVTSAVADDVQVKSVISSETQANAAIANKLNIDKLLADLNTTHAQVDLYSRSRTAEINEQAQKSIGDVLANTKRRQEELLVDANRRHLLIDNEYKLQLQKAVEALDAVKAKTLAELEHDLQGKQQLILAEAKQLIDQINDQANAAKLHALVEAQEQAKQNIANLTDQVAVLGQQDTQHLLQSKTTTIITSQAQAAGSASIVVATDHQVATDRPTEIVTVAHDRAGSTDTLHTTAHTSGNNNTTVTSTDVKTTHDNTTF